MDVNGNPTGRGKKPSSGGPNIDFYLDSLGRHSSSFSFKEPLGSPQGRPGKGGKMDLNFKWIFLPFAALILLFIVWNMGFAVIPVGHVGIVDTFGVVSAEPQPPGFYLKMPWTRYVPMSIMSKQIEENADTPTNEGLNVGLDVSIVYRIDPAVAPQIYKTIGLSYEDVIIRPTFRSAIRDTTAKNDAKSLYTSGRGIMASEIVDQITPKLKERGIIVESVMLRALKLPASVQAGVEAKLVAEQDSQRMQFILQKETQEADRKKIEAEGIARAQAIIDKTLTGQYLKYLWIQSLDKHQNVIYVPIDNGGFPLIKNVDLNMPEDYSAATNNS